MPASRSAVRTSALALGAGVLAALSLAGPTSAKEPTGNVVITTTLPPAPSGCSPMHSFKTSGDSSVGDTGLSSISADYDVKPCDSKQTVTVSVLVYELFDPTNVLRDEPEAPLSGRFTVTGVKLGTLYRVAITIRDAATGVTIAEVDRSASAPVPTRA
jgi:hypothetical protein